LSSFPPEPVSPRVFFEDTIPGLFAEVVLNEAERSVELKVGVVLQGEQAGEHLGERGGEWTLHFIDGELGITDGRAEDCDITIVQRVEDWRSALWEGRPGLIADAVAVVAESGLDALRSFGDVDGPRNPAALDELSEIRGLIEAIIASETDGVDDWRLAIQIGPGPIPVLAQATIRLGADQADAIRRGELHPVEALIKGQLRLEGDFGLIIQLQAIAMAASMRKPETG
jgi:hypothetical protein